MKLKALRAHWLADSLQPVGSVYEASEADARLLVSLGKAEPAPAEPPAPATPKRAAPRKQKATHVADTTKEPAPAAPPDQEPTQIEKDPENA